MQQRYPPFEPSQAVEQRMYEGFPSRADESRVQAFHAAGWGERAAIAETIEDDRYRELARRIVFLEQPDALQPERRQMLGVWLQNRRLGREGVEAGRTIGNAMIDLEGIVRIAVKVFSRSGPFPGISRIGGIRIDPITASENTVRIRDDRQRRDLLQRIFDHVFGLCYGISGVTGNQRKIGRVVFHRVIRGLLLVGCIT